MKNKLKKYLILILCVLSISCSKDEDQQAESVFFQPVISLEPNPTTGPLMVDLTFPYEIIYVWLYNINGNVVGTWIFENSSKFEIDLGNQSSGIYLLGIVVQNGNTQSEIQKFKIVLN